MLSTLKSSNYWVLSKTRYWWDGCPLSDGGFTANVRDIAQSLCVNTSCECLSNSPSGLKQDRHSHHKPQPAAFDNWSRAQRVIYDTALKGSQIAQLKTFTKHALMSGSLNHHPSYKLQEVKPNNAVKALTCHLPNSIFGKK